MKTAYLKIFLFVFYFCIPASSGTIYVLSVLEDFVVRNPHRARFYDKNLFENEETPASVSVYLREFDDFVNSIPNDVEIKYVRFVKLILEEEAEILDQLRIKFPEIEICE